MRAIKIFYCYAHEDKTLRDELEKHLTPLKRTGQITEWYDRDIQGGTDWESEIETHLTTANIILLLVSPDFIFSDYCYGVEMKKALDRHKAGQAHVIPIILRPVLWQETPIGVLQALPTDGEPVTLWPNRDKAFWDVVKGIHEVVRKLTIKLLRAEEEEARKVREEQARKTTVRSGRLRLDVAQLTDVGRKREHNEDNMAFVIPKDLQVMVSKGALFMVADGMEEHAAGEVASEIAVDTVSNMYYQEDSTDVVVSLLRAIKRANASIHQKAAEILLRSSMGTTCVAAVLRGNIAYIANVGNSRAYLVRGNQVMQISQDHSWVAEQVRAGLLTEEQARTHAQRNVITRCLGTQAEVDVDVFKEELHKGDSLILCTAGLSNMVSENELLQIVSQFVPQESVYRLVERANELGGPENITVLVAQVHETGEEL